jgi:hypothetical protein
VSNNISSDFDASNGGTSENDRKASVGKGGEGAEEKKEEGAKLSISTSNTFAAATAALDEDAKALEAKLNVANAIIAALSMENGKLKEKLTESATMIMSLQDALRSSALARGMKNVPGLENEGGGGDNNDYDLELPTPRTVQRLCDAQILSKIY